MRFPRGFMRQCLSARAITRNTCVLAFVLPGALLLACALQLFVQNGRLLFKESLWFPEFLALMGMLYVITGALGVLTARSNNQWNSGTFCGACVALASLSAGLFTIFICERSELARISRTLEPTLALRAFLEWIEAHSQLAGYLFGSLIFLQLAALVSCVVMGFYTYVDHLETEAMIADGLEQPLLEVYVFSEDSLNGAYDAVKKHQAQRSWQEIGLSILLTQITLTGLVLLAVTVALAVASPPTDEPGQAPPSPASLATVAAPIYAPVESLSHHHHHHHHHRHGQSDPPSSQSRTGLQWYPGMLAVVGTPLFWTGGLATSGLWLGGISTIRSFAGAGVVALLYQLFGLHIYSTHRELLDRAAEYDASNGLRATLSWTDKHPVGTALVALAFLLLQALAVLASALYTRPVASAEDGSPEPLPEAPPPVPAADASATVPDSCADATAASPCSPRLKGVLDRFFADDHSDRGCLIPAAPQALACADPTGSPTSLDPFADAETGIHGGSGTMVEPAADIDLCRGEDDVCSSHQLRLRSSEDPEAVPQSPRSERSSCSSSSRSTWYSNGCPHPVDSPWGELPRVGVPHRIVWGRVGLQGDPAEVSV